MKRTLDNVYIMIRRPKKKRPIRELVEEKDSRGECLQCNAPRARGRRKLCQHHYSQFRDALRSLPPEKRGVYEETLINDGKLAEDRQGQKDIANPYRALASQLLER